MELPFSLCVSGSNSECVACSILSWSFALQNYGEEKKIFVITTGMRLLILTEIFTTCH